MLKVVSEAFIQFLQFNLMYFLKGHNHFHPFYPKKFAGAQVKLSKSFPFPATGFRFSSPDISFTSFTAKDKVQRSFHSPAPPSTILIKTQHQSPSLVCRSYESCQPSPFYTQEQELWLFLFNAPPAGAAARD